MFISFPAIVAEWVESDSLPFLKGQLLKNEGENMFKTFIFPLLMAINVCGYSDYTVRVIYFRSTDAPAAPVIHFLFKRASAVTMTE